ncbi:MAG TPA: LSM domain-containing protein [Candidatus Bathyarchaeia archaeon]|nr:LSM domain-containing protein [Candidatus Bathyarchaeia archaeon]
MTRPLPAIYSSIGKEVIVICKDGTEYAGRIFEVDENMNIVLSDAKINGNANSEKDSLFLLRGMLISIVRLNIQE